MPQHSYSREELERAVAALSDPSRFRRAEEVVAATAPELQRILAETLAGGGWFDESHQTAVREAISAGAEEERLAAVRTLLAEESRITMMIGVAVGWALAEELQTEQSEEEE